MKFLRKLILFLILALLLFVAAASFYIKRYGKGIIEEAVSTSLKRNFTMANIRYQFPLGFAAEGVDLEKIFQAKNISAQFSLAAIFSKRLDIVYVILKNPLMRVERSTVAPAPPEIPGGGGGAGSAPGRKHSGKKFEVFIRRLFVHDGEIQYFQELPDRTYQFVLKEVQLKAERIALPLKPLNSNFSLSGRMAKNVTPFAESLVEASGWFNWPKRDLRAKLTLTQPDGGLGLSANAVSKNNQMNVSGEIKMEDFITQAVRQARPKEEAGGAGPGASASINDLIMDSLSSMGVEIGAQFSFQTKMDDFQLNAVSFSGSLSAKEGLPF